MHFVVVNHFDNAKIPQIIHIKNNKTFSWLAIHNYKKPYVFRCNATLHGLFH